jgi:transposase
MIPAAYSYDLRKRVMEEVDLGVKVSVVASQFHVGKTTIYEWQQRRQETGDFRSKKLGSSGYGYKITDWDAFKVFAQEHGHKTQAEMAEAWEGVISRQTIHKALKKINFTRKKRPMGTKNEMMPNGKPL